VLAIGHGRLGKDGELAPLAVKTGDRILFGRYAGTEIKVDGEERLVLREDEVFGVLG
jgi:chaperonin GroES